MGLFSRRRQKSAATVTFSPQLVEVIRGWDGSLRSYGTLYRHLAPVRTVVDFLADAVSTTSLKFYERQDGGRPEARDHPAAKLLRHPNPELSTMTLIGGTVRDIAVYGVSYWWKREENGFRFLVPLAPERVMPKGGDILAPSEFEYYRLQPSTPVTIPRSEMVYMRLYTPEDRRIGSSKLEALRPLLAEEIEVSRHRQKFWRNAARREGVIMRPVDAPDWMDDSRERFRADWQNRTAGEGNAGKTAILEEGMKWMPDSFSPRESEFVEGRRLILEATARVFNIPVSLLGLTATATFASQREFAKQLYQQTFPFWYQLLESEIGLQVLPWFGTTTDELYAEFNVESKLRGSFEEQAQIIEAAVGRPWMVVKEIRDMFNLPDRGDPSDLEIAIPVNNVALGSAPAPEPARPQLQAVASRAPSLKEALDRQQRSVLSKVGAGGTFDPERWNRELAATLANWEDAG